MPKIRHQWILDRNDVMELPEISSEYGQKRLNDASLDSIIFKYCDKPLKAKQGMIVTQLHYAKKGIITPEMEFIAIRENQQINELNNNSQLIK